MPPFNISNDHQMCILHHFWPTFLEERESISYCPNNMSAVLLWGKSTQMFQYQLQKSALNFFNPYFRMVVILKPKHFYQIFSYSYLGVLVDHLGEDVSTLNIVKHNGETESRAGQNDRKRKRQREKKSTRDIKMDYRRMSGGQKRKKKDIYICSSMQSTRLCFPSPRWCTQGSNDECTLSQSPLLTLQVHQPSCCWQTRKKPLHYSVLLLFWKWTLLRMNVWSRQHKFGQNWEWRS